MRPSLPSPWLDAFLAVAQSGSFSRAAKMLHVTQSALSQRVKNLEDEIGTIVIERAPGRARPTAAGEQLLAYCQARHALEREVLDAIASPAKGKELRGVVRIGCYSSSSVGRSVVLPALAPLLRDHPQVQLEMSCVRTRDIVQKLRSGAYDLILVDTDASSRDIVSHVIGFERYVMVESVHHPQRANVLLDHDDDNATARRFLEKHRHAFTSEQRSVLHHIYAVVDAVALGLGRAIVPEHLVRDNRQLRIVEEYEPWPIPINLHYRHSLTASSLHRQVIASLRAAR